MLHKPLLALRIGVRIHLTKTCITLKAHKAREPRSCQFDGQRQTVDFRLNSQKLILCEGGGLKLLEGLLFVEIHPEEAVGFIDIEVLVEIREELSRVGSGV